ncbi:hypothetical protein TNCV_170451 [Trichonephila clavipes]|nr:hypothetical protein TNCV_170451 [Trichonephila clavipes]
MMIPSCNRWSALLSIRNVNPLQAKIRLLFPKKIEPCLTLDSNPNPPGYKPRVISTVLAGRKDDRDSSKHVLGKKHWKDMLLLTSQESPKVHEEEWKKYSHFSVKHSSYVCQIGSARML